MVEKKPDIVLYCDDKLDKLLDMYTIRNGYVSSYGYRGDHGIIADKFKDMERLLPKVPSPYIPINKREPKILANQDEFLQAILECCKKAKYKLSSGLGLGTELLSIIQKCYENPLHKPGMERRAKERRLLYWLYKVAAEYILKVHTDCICGTEENPVEAFKNLLTRDYFMGFNGKNIEDFIENDDDTWSKVSL